MKAEKKRSEMVLTTKQIADNERLADSATGIDNHPKPLTQIEPLVNPSDQDREFPYSK